MPVPAFPYCYRARGPGEAGRDSQPGWKPSLTSLSEPWRRLSRRCRGPEGRRSLPASWGILHGVVAGIIALGAALALPITADRETMTCLTWAARQTYHRVSQPRGRVAHAPLAPSHLFAEVHMGQPSKPLRVAVIATVLNEEASVAELIDSLANQTRRPDEVIIADGGSTDGTVERIRIAASDRLGVTILHLLGANIAEGRNAAVLNSTSDVIAVTDAGVSLKPTWLQQLVTPFEKRRGRLDVVSGFFEPAPRTVFEIAMGATVLPT